MSSINYSEKIPNNVNLSDDRRLQRALEQWQPHFLDWWKAMGPDGSHNFDVYLRTAIDVSPKGWAHFDTVKMPDYRWGIFLADPVADRRIGFGDAMGQPVWQQVPGEYRSTLRRLIVTPKDFLNVSLTLMQVSIRHLMCTPCVVNSLHCKSGSMGNSWCGLTMRRPHTSRSL